jgi:hypothetical protein
VASLWRRWTCARQPSCSGRPDFGSWDENVRLPFGRAPSQFLALLNGKRSTYGRLYLDFPPAAEINVCYFVEEVKYISTGQLATQGGEQTLGYWPRFVKSFHNHLMNLDERSASFLTMSGPQKHKKGLIQFAQKVTHLSIFESIANGRQEMRNGHLW